jgi:hypothetical protein
MATSRVARRRSLPITFLLFSIFCVTGLTSCSNSPAAAAAATVWLCRPGLAHDPCTASLETTVVNGTGSKRVADFEPASHPAIDCFYVYPLVSLQTTPNTTLRIDPQETAIAELEASPFSRVCRVFAPMYQQVTFSSVSSQQAQQAQQVAYDSVLAAWRDYLAHYNDGRGVVLIGHSEGADELDQLISGQIDNDASVRRLLVSAILTGGNLTVGADGTGPFSEIGVCRSASQTGCVVAYNAFFQPPPSDALFGRPDPPVLNGIAQQEVCTNPAALAGGTGTLVSAYRVQLPTQEVAGSATEGILEYYPAVSTPWIQLDDQYSASCVKSDGANVLMVTQIHDGSLLTAVPDSAWGLHVDDPNLALGNLVDLVQSEAAAYISAHRPTA